MGPCVSDDPVIVDLSGDAELAALQKRFIADVAKILKRRAKRAHRPKSDAAEKEIGRLTRRFLRQQGEQIANQLMPAYERALEARGGAADGK